MKVYTTDELKKIREQRRGYSRKYYDGHKDECRERSRERSKNISEQLAKLDAVEAKGEVQEAVATPAKKGKGKGKK